MEDIVKVFKENLKNKMTDIGSLYHHIFSILPEEDLKEILESWLTEYNEDKENWFYYFHKSIRQCDFFGLSLHRYVDRLTDEQYKRRNELLKIRNKQ